MSISAKVIADSVANNIRLTTLELNYPLIIHGQFLTHRVFSRNAESNRAMPNSKVVEQVVYNPAMPSRWGKNQPGMQDGGDHDALVDTMGMGMEEDMLSPKRAWKEASNVAVGYSEAFAEAGYHKQIANKLTMPFQYIKVIVTATEWDNFFKLRLNDADPTMIELARKMKEAMNASSPKELKQGKWHLPYVSQTMLMTTKEALKCSVARCARVSYNNHDNKKPDIQKDIELADKLLEAGHMSPFEHQATRIKYPRTYANALTWQVGVTHTDKNNDAWSGNFKGWVQYRNLINV